MPRRRLRRRNRRAAITHLLMLIAQRTCEVGGR
jgi:hypothetical protein